MKHLTRIAGNVLFSALLAQLCAGQGPTQRAAAKAIVVKIEPYVAVSLSGTTIVVREETPGTGVYSGSVDFRISSNDDFTISVSRVIRPVGYQGRAVLTASSSITGGTSGSETAGRLTVNGVGGRITDLAGTYSDGRVTLTVAQS